jgi:hypothetical protein
MANSDVDVGFIGGKARIIRAIRGMRRERD